MDSSSLTFLSEWRPPVLAHLEPAAASPEEPGRTNHGSFVIRASVLMLNVGSKQSGLAGRSSKSVSPVMYALPAMSSATECAGSRSVSTRNASSPGHILPQLAW